MKRESCCDPDLFVSPAYGKKRPLSKAAEKLTQFPLEQIVHLVLAVNNDNVPNTFVLQGAREIANRAANPHNEEDFYDAGAISALVDLLLEEDEKLKTEALTALINISVSEQGQADIIGAGIMMLVVALVGDDSEPLIQTKASWLLINLTSAPEVRDVVREENGVSSLMRMVQSTDIRVQRMALKAINNMLTDCKPFLNQEAFVESNAMIVFLKMLLTLPAEESMMIRYVLNILSSLILCPSGLSQFKEKGLKIILRTLTVYKDVPEIRSMVTFLFAQIAQDFPQEIIQLDTQSLFLSLFFDETASQSMKTDLLNIFCKTMDDNFKVQFVRGGGIPILLDTFSSSNYSLVDAAAPTLFLLSKTPQLQPILKNNNIISALIKLLGFSDRKFMLIAFSILEIFLSDKECAEQFANNGGIMKLLSFAFAGDDVFVVKALETYNLIADFDFVKQKSAEVSSILHLVKLIFNVKISLQCLILNILTKLCTGFDANLKLLVDSQQLKTIGSFLSGASSNIIDEVNRAQATRELLMIVKEYLPRHNSTPTLETKVPVHAPEPEPEPEPEPIYSDEKSIPNPPSDPAQKTLIDKLAALVVTKGDAVEQQAIQKQGNHPSFQFLIDENSEGYKYYQYMKNWLREGIDEPEEESKEETKPTVDPNAEKERFERLRIEGEEWRKQQEEEERKRIEEEQRKKEEEIERKKQEKIQAEQEAAERAEREKLEEEARIKKEQEENTLAKLDADLDEINSLMDMDMGDLGLGDFNVDDELLKMSAPEEPQIDETVKDKPDVSIDSSTRRNREKVSDTELDDVNSFFNIKKSEDVEQIPKPDETSVTKIEEKKEKKKKRSSRREKRKSSKRHHEDKESTKEKSSKDHSKKKKKRTKKSKKEKEQLLMDAKAIDDAHVSKSAPTLQNASPLESSIFTDLLNEVGLHDISTPTITKPKEEKSIIEDEVVSDTIEPEINDKQPELAEESPIINEEKTTEIVDFPVKVDETTVTINDQLSEKIEEPSTTLEEQTIIPVEEKSSSIENEAPKENITVEEDDNNTEENNVDSTKSTSKIVKCSYKGKNVNLRVDISISLDSLKQQIAPKYQKDTLDGIILQYKDDGDLVDLESSDDLELAFELSGRRLDIILLDSEKEQPDIIEPIDEPKEEEPPKPAPPPPPPVPAPPPLALPSLPSVAKFKGRTTPRKEGPSLNRNLTMKDEMLSFKLKKTNRDLTKNIRGRKEVRQDDGDIVGLLMKAMDSRRVHIAEEEAGDEWDDEDEWGM